MNARPGPRDTADRPRPATNSARTTYLPMTGRPNALPRP